MTKEEMINYMAETAGISKRQANDALDAFMNGVTSQLKKNNKISFAGFGTFSVSQRKARTGRNPQTGESIKIPATKVPVFKAGKNLKEAIKKK
jgi:DNA-binding protein HU-beta